MLLRQFCAACPRSRPVSSIRTSFSAAAKTSGVTSGPTGATVPNAGGDPGVGCGCVAGGVAPVWARLAGGAAPTSAAADVTRKARRELRMTNTPWGGGVDFIAARRNVELYLRDARASFNCHPAP